MSRLDDIEKGPFVSRSQERRVKHLVAAAREEQERVGLTVAFRDALDYAFMVNGIHEAADSDLVASILTSLRDVGFMVVPINEVDK